MKLELDPGVSFRRMDGCVHAKALQVRNVHVRGAVVLNILIAHPRAGEPTRQVVARLRNFLDKRLIN